MFGNIYEQLLWQASRQRQAGRDRGCTDNTVSSLFLRSYSGAEDMAQSVKVLPWEHENPHKSQVSVAALMSALVCTCTPTLDTCYPN